MGQRPKNHEQTIRTIISYMETHLLENITLESIAKHACFSVRWIQDFFKRETGTNLFSYLLRLRINKSKDLLTGTDLNITEIGYEVGFNSYTRFAIAFREQEGMAPGEFRKSAKLRGEFPVSVTFQPDSSRTERKARFRDMFDGTELKPCWKIDTGEWRLENGELAGKSEEGASLFYTDPLPENFLITFDFCFLAAPHLTVYLRNGTFSEDYLEAVFGRDLNGIAELRFRNSDRYWSHGAHITPDSWHKFGLEIIDDTVKVFLDDVELLSARNPFPPDFSARSHLVIFGWQTQFKIRNVAIYDHGFLPMVPAVRQADTLYKNGMYDAALNTYLRLLEAATKPADVVEIQYKIGMCYLRQHAFVQSRAWLSKVAALPQNDFWFLSARHSLLELHRQERDYSSFLENARSMFAGPKNRNGVRACIDRARMELMNEGFYDRALECVQALHDLEEPDSLFSTLVENKFHDLLFPLRRYGDATEHLERIIQNKNTPDPVALNSLNNLADALTHSGDFEASEEVLDRFKKRTARQYDLVRCDLIHGMNLRGQQHFDEAALFLSQTLERYPGATHLGVFAVLMGANVYCLLGDVRKAKEILQDMEKRYPDNYCVRGFYRSTFFYPPLFLEGKLDLAGELLLEEARKGASYWSANHMVRAGILFELSGGRDRAVSVWSEVTRRFRPDRCCFYGDLARNLIQEEKDILETMPYPAINRAEMFYLAGLLFRNRNQGEKARKYFQLAVKDDPTLNWFTWLAKKGVTQ